MTKICETEKVGNDILNLLQEYGPLHFSRIKELLGLSQNCLVYATRLLKKDGLIKIAFWHTGSQERPKKHYFLVNFVEKGLNLEGLIAEERRRFRGCENCINWRPWHSHYHRMVPCVRCIRNPKYKDEFEQ